MICNIIIFLASVCIYCYSIASAFYNRSYRNDNNNDMNIRFASNFEIDTISYPGSMIIRFPPHRWNHLYGYDEYEVPTWHEIVVHHNDFFKNKSEKYREDTQIDCPICLEKIINGKMTLCNHIYCSDCIMRWLSRSLKCPMCNQDMFYLWKMKSSNNKFIPSFDSSYGINHHDIET